MRRLLLTLLYAGLALAGLLLLLHRPPPPETPEETKPKPSTAGKPAAGTRPGKGLPPRKLSDLELPVGKWFSEGNVEFLLLDIDRFANSRRGQWLFGRTFSLFQLLLGPQRTGKVPVYISRQGALLAFNHPQSPHPPRVLRKLRIPLKEPQRVHTVWIGGLIAPYQAPGGDGQGMLLIGFENAGGERSFLEVACPLALRGPPKPEESNGARLLVSGNRWVLVRPFRAPWSELAAIHFELQPRSAPVLVTSITLQRPRRPTPVPPPS